MSTRITEQYEHIKELTEKLEEAIRWVEDAGENIRLTLTLYCEKEGRNFYPPLWLDKDVRHSLQALLQNVIYSTISDKVAALDAAEKAFKSTVAAEGVTSATGAQYLTRLTEATNKKVR